MKIIFKRISIAMLMITTVVSSLAFSGCGKTVDVQQTEDIVSRDVKLLVWGAEEDQEVLSVLCKRFKELHPECNITIDISIESESTVKDTILNDMNSMPDVYSFASNQLYDLHEAGALTNLDIHDDTFVKYCSTTLTNVKAANVESSVEAASIKGQLFAFPRTADNGYFLYYDKNIVSDLDSKKLDSILYDCAKAKKKFGMTIASGWYNASFFYAAGFKTDRNDDGTTFIDWNGTSDMGYTGVDVMKSMMAMVSHEGFKAIPDGRIGDDVLTGEYAAFVSGTWDADVAQKVFKDGYAATALPTFTCAGDQLQMADAAGYKFFGINPKSEELDWAIALGEFLSNEDSQRYFFEKRQAGPTNKVAAADDSVKKNTALCALLLQHEKAGVSQQVGQKFWIETVTLGEMLIQGKLDKDDTLAIQSELDAFVKRASAKPED